ncbi:MAG: FG-GAP-like repeat-containing protein, partial [Acidobacteriota bacterium]
MPNQTNQQASTLGARYTLSLIQEEALSLSGYEPNRYFQNRGTFSEVSGVLGVDSLLDGRGVASGDLDGDGDLDLVVSNRNYPHITIFRNDHRGGNHFVAISLQGTESNRMGIGARITVTC